MRKPVDVRGHRVQGLDQCTTANGREVFEFRGRLGGQFANRVLEATNKSEVEEEVLRLRSEGR